MKIQSNGKVRRTTSEWEAIFADFAASGLSVSAFCRREQIAKSSFSKRRSRRENKAVAPSPKAARFVELTPSQSSGSAVASAPVVAGHRFELELPGGVVLRWQA